LLISIHYMKFFLHAVSSQSLLKLSLPFLTFLLSLSYFTIILSLFFKLSSFPYSPRRVPSPLDSSIFLFGALLFSPPPTPFSLGLRRTSHDRPPLSSPCSPSLPPSEHTTPIFCSVSVPTLFPLSPTSLVRALKSF